MVKKSVDVHKESLNLFGNRIVEFDIENKISNVPNILEKYIKKYDNNKLSLEYDKKEISLSEIIEIFIK